MVEGVLRFPAEFQPPALADRERLEQAQVEIVRAVGELRIPADRGPIRKSRAFDPVDRGRIDAAQRVRIAVAGGARRPEDSAAGKRRAWVADVRAVIWPAVAIAVEAIEHGEGRAGLEGGDAGDRPAAGRAPPEALSRPRDLP